MAIFALNSVLRLYVLSSGFYEPDLKKKSVVTHAKNNCKTQKISNMHLCNIKYRNMVGQHVVKTKIIALHFRQHEINPSVITFNCYGDVHS